MNGYKYKDGMTFENDEFRLRIYKVSDNSIDCEFSGKRNGEYWEYKDISYSSFEAIRKQFNL